MKAFMSALHDTDQSLRELCLHSQIVLQGDFLQVMRDQVRLPDGRQAQREFVRHPGAVMVIPLLLPEASLSAEALPADPQVVLERQFRYPVQQVMVEFPAGKLDPGEHPWTCAQRELREETGYTATEWAHAGVLHPTVAYSTEVIDVWFARGLQAGARQLDEGEFLDVFTAPVSQLLAWCREGQVTDAKTLVGALWLQNFLSAAWPLSWRRENKFQGVPQPEGMP